MKSLMICAALLLSMLMVGCFDGPDVGTITKKSMSEAASAGNVYQEKLDGGAKKLDSQNSKPSKRDVLGGTPAKKDILGNDDPVRAPIRF